MSTYDFFLNFGLAKQIYCGNEHDIHLNLVTLCVIVYPPMYGTARYKVQRVNIHIHKNSERGSALWVVRGKESVFNLGHQVTWNKFSYYTVVVDLLPEATSILTLIGLLCCSPIRLCNSFSVLIKVSSATLMKCRF